MCEVPNSMNRIDDPGPQEYSESGSKVCYACNGCKHKDLATTGTGFCYMFDDKPETLPCGQHDKYENERRLTGAMMRKHPFMIQLLVLEALGKLLRE